jgi:tRNA (guanine-N7-)-methyltransferase
VGAHGPHERTQEGVLRKPLSENDSPPHPLRTGAFFGRRKGHPLRAAQAALFDSLLPRLALDPAALPAGAPCDWFPTAEDVRLEIGFGGGEHLAADAQRHPHSGYIGCDAFMNGVAKLLAAIEAQSIGNVRVCFGDAVVLIDALPDASLARVDLFYPDPWPKRRHWKRRFVQDATIAKLARVLRPGGVFRFASDIPDYVAWTLERLARSDAFAWTATRADDWRMPWPEFESTRYERKALREGRTPCYLTFERRD